MDWRGKTVIVAGGSSGLGVAIARASVQRGAQTVIVGRQASRLQQVAAELNSSEGTSTIAIQADLSLPADVDRLFDETRRACGRLDVLINCVGRSSRQGVLGTTPEDFAAAFEDNLLVAVRCTRAAVPLLRESRGSLVNIGSLASKLATRYLGAYPATKFALAAYTQQVRMELAEHGVHVLLVCPGPIARNDAGSRYESATDVPAAALGPGGGVGLKLIDPDRLAGRILTACEKRQFELIVPAKARLLIAAAAVSPRLGDWLLRKFGGG